MVAFPLLLCLSQIALLAFWILLRQQSPGVLALFVEHSKRRRAPSYQMVSQSFIQLISGKYQRFKKMQGDALSVRAISRK
jgi:hypothetical protein